MAMPVQQANIDWEQRPNYQITKERQPAFEEFLKAEGAALIDAFSIYDKDGNGQISMVELGDVFRACGQNPSDAELEKIKKEWDLNGNGKIEYDDFVQVAFNTFKSLKDMRCDLREAFKVFDKNGDGYINRYELKEVVTTVIKGNEALSVTEEEIDSMLAAADIDRDGSINYEEFCNIILNQSQDGV